MKIAQVAPLFESVPPKCYGGTERIVSYLTEELVKMGHDVTLYASGDSVTSARLVAMCNQALRLDKLNIDPVADHIVLAERIYRESEQYDIIHSSIDYITYPLFRRMLTPHITTLHGRLDIANLNPLYREFVDIPLVSISNYRRVPISWATWCANVYHGLPENLYDLNEKPKDYLAFIGRISPEKRADLAIEIAKQAGMKLKIAAKVDKADADYYSAKIEPLLKDNVDVEFIGEVGEIEKNDFLGNAYALLFPIDWPEPFGLVMIEAMACGTPVIARPYGSVPEIIEHGKTGFIVNTTDEAVAAIKNIPKLSRKNCRKTFEERFTAKIMAQNYLKVYKNAIETKLKSNKEKKRSN